MSKRPHQLSTKLAMETRRDRVMRLANAGKTTRQIAEILSADPDFGEKISHTTVAKDINARLKLIRENAANMPRKRAEAISRLDDLLGIWYARALASVENDGHIAVDRFVKIFQEYAKMTGIAMPEKIAISGDRSGPPIRVEADVDLARFTLEELKTLKDLGDKLTIEHDPDAITQEPDSD